MNKQIYSRFAVGGALALTTVSALAMPYHSLRPIRVAQAAGAAGTGASGNAAGTNGTGTNGTGTDAAGTNGATGNGTSSNNGTANSTNSNNTGMSGTNGVGSSNNTTTSNGTSSSNGTTGSTSGTTGSQGSLPLPRASRTPQTFNLAQTIQAGLASSADVQTAMRNVEIDRKNTDLEAAAGRPNISASGQATRYDQKTAVHFGATALQVTGTHEETLQLNVTDNLDLTGQIRAATDQARLQTLADEFTLRQVRNSRILRAQTLYFDALLDQHQVDVALASLAYAERSLTDATNLNNAEVGEKIDVYSAQTQVANAQQNLTSAQNNYSIALSNFNDLVGRPLDAPVTLVDPPGVIIAKPVTDTSTVGAPDALTAPPLPNAPAEVSAINLSQSLQAASAQRPEILQAQVNVRVNETGVKLARAGLEPTFSLNAGGNYYPTVNFQLPRQRTAQVTATLTIPLYDGGATHDRIQEAHLRTDNAKTSLASTQSDVALDVRQSYLNLVTDAQQISASNTALQSAIAAWQLAIIRYQGQVGLYLEVTDAQAALVQAENNQVDAVYNYLIARAQFQNSIGAPQIQ